MVGGSGEPGVRLEVHSAPLALTFVTHTTFQVHYWGWRVKFLLCLEGTIGMLGPQPSSPRLSASA